MKSETVGLLDNKEAADNAFLEIRQCLSQSNSNQNDEQDEQIIEQEITELEKEL